jgi:hypothetical protein
MAAIDELALRAGRPPHWQHVISWRQSKRQIIAHPQSKISKVHVRVANELTKSLPPSPGFKRIDIHKAFHIQLLQGIHPCARVAAYACGVQRLQ